MKHVLCDDSPEGHLPEEMEDIEGLDTKDLLSYSFRAIHESSNLMEIIVNGLRTRSIPSAMLPPLEVFHDVGQLTFDQLTRLRHRGAFTTVTSTFTTCCQVAENIQRLYLDLTENPNYLRQWYDVRNSSPHSSVDDHESNSIGGYHGMHKKRSIYYQTLSRYSIVGDWDTSSKLRLAVF